MRHPDERDNYLDAHRRNELLPMCPERTLRKLVGATGFEPATPCAQGKPRIAFEVLILE